MTDLKPITKPLMKWYQKNKREMPWRGSENPYSIWISEIMLQQTQVETVRPYFERFIEKFPTVTALAKADQQTVLKLWEGLGYYSRARNLHQAAKLIDSEYNGRLPESFDELLKIPGFGPYTSAAVASIAFHQSVPVIDGNVFRVFARLTEMSLEISKPQTRKHVFENLEKVIPKKSPGNFNQAIMELGAIICKPKNPKCFECPVKEYCSAFQNEKTGLYPVKKKAPERPHKQIAVGIVEKNGMVLIAKRRENQMLGGLWEFPGGKVESGESIEECLVREFKEEVDLDISVTRKLCEVDHAFTHFTITIHSYICSLKSGKAKPVSGSEIKWVLPEKLSEFPFPKANKVIIEKYLSTHLRTTLKPKLNK